MSNPTEEKKPNNWLFPAFILWGFAPAILMVLGSVSKFDELALLGLFGMPLIVYAWSVAFLIWRGKDKPVAYGFGILLALLMCVANTVVAAAGCSAVGVFPLG